jgi:hypothetical protein
VSESLTMPVEARRAERRDAMAASTMRAEGSKPYDVIVLDISATGVRITSDADLEVGQQISIGLAGAGVTRAYVAWRRGDQYGCAFSAPLSAEEEACAFSNAAPVMLGQPSSARRQPEPVQSNGLEDLYRQHHVWKLPADAVAGFVIFGGLVAYVLSFLIR